MWDGGELLENANADHIHTNTVNMDFTYLYKNGSRIIDFAKGVWQHPYVPPEPVENVVNIEDEEPELEVIHPPLGLAIGSMSRKGEITLQFSEEILSLEEVLETTGRNLRALSDGFNLTRMVDIEFDVRSDVGQLDYETQLQSWEASEVKLKIAFSNPMAVSRKDSPDLMKM